jgi:N-methylhydantoinase B
MSAARVEIEVFDKGPSIEKILERCEAETGLPAPRPPVNVRKAVRA